MTIEAGAINGVAPAFFCGNKRDAVPITMTAQAISLASRRIISSGQSLDGLGTSPLGPNTVSKRGVL